MVVPDERSDRKPVKNRLFRHKSGLCINQGDKMIICVMDVASVHDYLWLNCVSVSDVIVCHARLHLRGITFLVYSLSGARSVHGRAPLWSASTHLSLGRKRDPSIILQYLPWLLMHHHFHLQIPSLKHPADLNLATWRTRNPPPHP